MSIEVADWLAAVSAELRGNFAGVGSDLDARRRKVIMDRLGSVFAEYRTRVYESGFSGVVAVDFAAIDRMCAVALAHVDDTIRQNRRPDGLFHSYNLVDFGSDGSTATIEHLGEMLEGQVAVLGAGVLTPEEKGDVLEALFASAMYREDQRSFMLYPARRPPSFIDKNIVPAEDVATNPLLAALLEAGDRSIVRVDADGRFRFAAPLTNQAAVEAALARLGSSDTWRDLVLRHRRSTLDTYERVFRHRAFTGRSGSMYGYEGIGSIYWHMVAKLLVAVQDAALDAASGDATPTAQQRLADAYWRVRSGLGFNKTAAEYGAFPTDPYSHTPAHAGAQQPGMTGQVKEELLTRPLEVGVRVASGSIVFDPLLLRSVELLDHAEVWEIVDGGGRVQSVELAAGSLGLTMCQVPIVVSQTSGDTFIEVTLVDGTTSRQPGPQLDRTTSAQVFARTGDVAQIHVHLSLIDHDNSP